MKPTKSHNVEPTDQELQLFEALKNNPEILEQFTAIMQKFNQEVASGMDAYEAECHVIESVQKVGRTMIAKWAENTQIEAVQKACKSEDVIKNGKKNSTGIAPSEK